MADDPRWSVLLPTHHAPETLGFSIDSVLTQTDGDLELLLVGDGVTDETRALVARYSDERIRFFDRPKGPGFGYASRAEALETARGRFVAFASDDDLWAPDHLARLGGFLDSGAAIAHSRSFWCRPDGLLVPVPFDAADPANRERFEAENFVPSSCWAVSRQALLWAGGWPTEFTETADWALWRRIMAQTDAVAAATGRVTTLHFRATRRDRDHGAVGAMVEVVTSREGWPDDCRIAIPAGSSAQAAVVSAAAGDPQLWWDRVSDAAARVVDRTALAALVELPALERELRAYETSTSWRVTAPLRWLKRLVTRTG